MRKRRLLAGLGAVLLAAAPVWAEQAKVQLPLPQGWTKVAEGKPLRQFGAPALGYQSIAQFHAKDPASGQVVLARKPIKGALATDLQALKSEIATVTTLQKTFTGKDGQPCGIAYQVKAKQGLNGWLLLGDRDGQRRGIAVLAQPGVLTEPQVLKLAESIGITAKAAAKAP